MTSIHKIPVSHVEVGMFVSETTPGLAKTGLNSRGMISRADTLATLKNSGVDEIHIDTSKGKSSTYSSPISIWDNASTPQTKLKEERKRAAKVYGEARSLVGSLISNVKLGKPIEVGPVEDLAEEISGSVLANSNALMCLSQIREKDQYLLEHSINVGILMGVFARYLGYKDETLHQLVTGALLHDIGKIRVPSHILNKQGKLTDSEWDEMKKHVLYGEEVLLNSPGITDIAISICAQHHEKMSGGGYPRNLKGDQISNVGRIASIVDIYDAITADRCYHNGKSPFSTMKILVDLAKNDLDKNLVYQFVRCMGIYPVGTLVELDNGRLGVVEQTDVKKPDSPIVKLFFDMKKRSYDAEQIINLADPDVELRIAKAHNPDEIKIKVKDVI